MLARTTLPLRRLATLNLETNYLHWAKLTTGLLRSKGLWGYIDGSCPKPDTENKDEVKKWEKEKYKA